MAVEAATIAFFDLLELRALALFEKRIGKSEPIALAAGSMRYPPGISP